MMFARSTISVVSADSMLVAIEEPSSCIPFSSSSSILRSHNSLALHDPVFHHENALPLYSYENIQICIKGGLHRKPILEPERPEPSLFILAYMPKAFACKPDKKVARKFQYTRKFIPPQPLAWFYLCFYNVHFRTNIIFGIRVLIGSSGGFGAGIIENSINSLVHKNDVNF